MQEKFTQVQQNYTKQSDGESALAISFYIKQIFIRGFSLHTTISFYFNKKRIEELAPIIIQEERIRTHIYLQETHKQYANEGRDLWYCKQGQS